MTWFRSLLTRRNAPMARTASRRGRLVLEGLEDRLVLATANLLVSTAGTYPQQVFKEFTSTGSLVRTVNIPAPPGTSSDTARDLAQDSSGKVYVYNGTFTPALATYNPSTSSWSQQNYAGWSTVNNVSYGGLALYQNYIFATDMTTAGDPAGQSNGVVRFNLTNSTATRFANGTDFTDLNVGLDGKVYALAGQTVSVYDPSTLALLRTITLPSGNDYRGLAVNAAGDIFTANWGNTVTRFNSSGALVNSVTLTGPGGGTWFGAPMDIDIANDGTVAVGTYSGHVVQMTSSLTNITYFLASGTAGVFVTFAYQPPPPPSVSVADYAAVEGNSGTTAFPFAVTLSSPYSQNVTVNYSVLNGTALAGSDYQSSSGSITIPAGQTTQNITVFVYGDTTYEPDETFTVKLTGVTGGATLGRTQATGTILNDDVPSVTVFGYTTAEGNSGTTAFTFTVNLSAASNQTVTVNYATSDGTAAAAGSDYQATSGTVTFAPGQTTQNVTVLVNGDTVDELDESFYVTLSNPVNATVSGLPGRGTILNDDLTVSVSDAAPVTEGNSGTTPASFTISLSAPSPHSVTVGYYTAGGTATSGSDYTMTNGTLTFNPGQTSATITVPILGDTAYEGNETFNLYLSQPANVALGRAVGTGTITDDDTAPTLSVSDASVAEGNSGMIACLFTVSLSAASSQTVTLTYSTAPGTATANSDYQSVTSSLSFSPGQTSKQVTVWVIGDTLLEANETFTLNLSNPSGAVLARAQGTGTIIDDDGPVSLSIADSSAYEGNSGTTWFTFTASLSGPSGNTVSVYYTTMNGTATAGSDYQSTGGTLTFSPDQTTKTFTIAVYGDTVYEPNETFYVTLSGATGASIARAQAVGTILNDDIGLSIADYSQYEGSSGTQAFVFTATLTAASNQTVTVSYATANGSATAGSDYQAASGTLTFAPGQTSQAITVLVNGDTLNEANETFTVTLSGLSGASMVRSVATGTILNDDPLPSLTVGDVSVSEGNSGTTPASFTLSLSAASGQTITLNYTTAAGTATASSDYTATSGTLTFAPGQTSATVAVSVIGDKLVEPDETFTVNLSNPVNVTLARSQAVGTILNDDHAPVANAGPNQTVNEGAVVTLDASGSSDADGDSLTFSWSFGDGAGGGGATPTHVYVDNGVYTATVTVSDGYNVSSGTVTVTVQDVAPTAALTGPADGVPGQDRTFTFTANDPSPVDQAAPFTYQIIWSDGSSQTVQGPASGVQLTHAFTQTGAYTVTVTATDKDSATGAAASQAITVVAAEMQGNDLIVGGTTGDDQITIQPADANGTVDVVINGQDQGSFVPAGQIVVYGQAGNDAITVVPLSTDSGSITLALPVVLFGGDGNDTLDARGASGPAVLSGGAGDDTLYGGSGRNLLLGSTGSDILHGGSADDLLMGGVTNYDANLIALMALQAEWGRTDADYQTRISHLNGSLAGGLNGSFLLNGQTVTDDGSVDDLYGDQGQDWFFVATGGANPDQLHDLEAGESVTNL